MGNSTMTPIRVLASDPPDRIYAELIRNAYDVANPTRMRAAMAYATHSGVAELVDLLGVPPSTWNQVRKKWLVGIDFCRSDPIALTHLNRLKRSELRVFDGEFVVNRRGCVPRTSFHPKLFEFRGEERSAVVAGSGNLSRTGLRIGVEAGIYVSRVNAADVEALDGWFDRQWSRATPIDTILSLYEYRHRDSDNRRNPVPTEDDVAPASANLQAHLGPAELRKLKTCTHLWIQAGNLHANRGSNQPGNQLMMKRNTRVFFGFPAIDLPTDTAIGNIAIEYQGNLRSDCSLRFSNNSMDVQTLPIPGTEGPAKYDQETICFERIGVRRFRLLIGNSREKSRWKRASRAIDGAFKMKSGREWGVF